MAPEPPAADATPSGPRVFGLVPAAGRGVRFGGDVQKQFREVAGRPVLAWTAERLLAAGVGELTIAVPADLVEEAPQSVLDDPRVHWVAGGSSRQESVAACLAASAAGPQDLVLVHDGARPAVGEHDVAACIEAAGQAEGAILGRPVADTLKLVADGEIQGTVDRAFLFRAETPQVFRREILERAMEEAARSGFQGTDEASLVERLPGVRLLAVAAVRPNPKLTEPGDLEILESLLRGVASSGA